MSIDKPRTAAGGKGSHVEQVRSLSEKEVVSETLSRPSGYLPDSGKEGTARRAIVFNERIPSGNFEISTLIISFPPAPHMTLPGIRVPFTMPSTPVAAAPFGGDVHQIAGIEAPPPPDIHRPKCPGGIFPTLRRDRNRKDGGSPTSPNRPPDITRIPRPRHSAEYVASDDF